MIYDRAVVAASYYLTKQVIAPGAARRYAHPHGSSTRGGSAVRTALVAGQLQAASVAIV